MRSALLLLAACSGASTKSPIAAEDLDQAFADAQCARAVRCGEMPDLATCQGAYNSFHFPGVVLESNIAAIGEGKINYDGGAARTCIEAYANAPCDSTVEANRLSDVACDRIFVGTGADGTACGLNFECVSEFCDVPSCTVDCCTGTCSGSTKPVRAKIGEACSTLPCTSGSYCEFSTMTCTALVAAGASCTNSFQCAYGTGCIGIPKTCQPLPKVGEPCPDNLCRDQGVVCNAAKICTQVGLPGAPCTTDLDCSHFYGCGADGTCGVRDPGGACITNNDCFEADTYCAAGTCSPPQPNGAACADDRDCASDHCDDSLTTPACTDEPICT